MSSMSSPADDASVAESESSRGSRLGRRKRRRARADTTTAASSYRGGPRLGRRRMAETETTTGSAAVAVGSGGGGGAPALVGRSRSLLLRAADFLDSFHGVEAGSPTAVAAAAPSSSKSYRRRTATELDVWRLRCLVLVSWSTGLSGSALVPIYLLGSAASRALGLVLLAGSLFLVAVPELYRRRTRCVPDADAAARAVAGTALVVMTVLSVGSGGYPAGLVPGIQRILPILVLCFGSLELGGAVTLYVMAETAILAAIGPLQPMVDESVLKMVVLGSWLLQPVLLLVVGMSLHAAGTQTVDKLRAASDAKTRFLSVVSHELRTPLHGILGSCQLALSDLVECGQEGEGEGGSDRSDGACSADGHDAGAVAVAIATEGLRTIEIAAEHLSGIVEDLLLYSSSSAVRMQRRRFGVSDLLRTAEATLSSTAAGCGCPLEFRIASHLDPDRLWFLGDELRLRQCLINVAANAIKFCGADCDADGGLGGGDNSYDNNEVTPCKHKVTVSLEDITPIEDDERSDGEDDPFTSTAPRHLRRQPRAEVVFTVRDTGPGISPEDAARIFQPFEQGSGAGGRWSRSSGLSESPAAASGVGLGLAIVSELLAKMDGSVWVASPGTAKGRGATFYLTARLPRADPPSREEAVLVELPLSTSSGQQRGGSGSLVGGRNMALEQVRCEPERERRRRWDNCVRCDLKDGGVGVTALLPSEAPSAMAAAAPTVAGPVPPLGVGTATATATETPRTSPPNAPAPPSLQPGHAPAVPRPPAACPPSSPSPIVLAAPSSLDLSALSPPLWNGEAGMFEVHSDGRESWDALVESVRDAAALSVDVVLFDGSDGAWEAAARLRGWIDEFDVPAVPLIRVCEDFDREVAASSIFVGGSEGRIAGPAANNAALAVAVGVGGSSGRSLSPPTADLFDATVHPLALPALARSWHRALALGAWILVVDDVALNRRVLGRQLTKLGHRVTEAADGIEACEAAAGAGYAMDMIAMDLMMPRMDGPTAAREIAKAERTVRGRNARPCPIFAVTAGDVGLLRSGEDASAFHGFMRKPTTPQQLRGMVRYQVIKRLLPVVP